MAPNPRRQDEKLEALYAQLPKIDCKGLCSDSCGPIEMSVRERQRIEGAAGEPLTCGLLASCSMLTEDRRCSQYALRPMICRLWGLTRSLACPYGCRPERWVEDKEAARLLGEVDVVGGAPTGREARLRRVLNDNLALIEAAEYMAATTVRPSIEGRRDSMPKRMIDR